MKGKEALVWLGFALSVFVVSLIFNGSATAAGKEILIGAPSLTANQWWDGKQMLFYPISPAGYKLKLALPWGQR